MSQTVLSVRGVVNRFGEHVVHDGVSFDVQRGEIVGVVGGSGSGKTVLLQTMVGLRRPQAGEVTICGEKADALKPHESPRLFGVLFQQGALFSGLTVEQNVAFPLKEYAPLPKAYRRMLAYLKIALAGLPQEAGVKYPSELSGGMIKRAALARALALDPPILFLDEPTSGLDPIGAAEFDRLILDLNHSLGVTVVMITHDLDTLFSICTRVAVLVDKQVIIDTLPNLLKNEHPWIKAYFQGPRGRAAEQAGQAARGTE
ncbi:MAG: ATP-binding cassette domain-containing protein [Alphaproteobacteria bacterium]|nr:ATP-binding cassette domain-containing protein [Alphaproteobacteria bacterium]